MWSKRLPLASLVIVFIISVVNCQEDRFTAKEKGAIEKTLPLRKIAGPLHPNYLNEDFMLLNFLRDSEFNVNDANTKLKESVEWRKMNKIDGIQREKILPELHPYRVDGHDRKGRPLAYVSPARWDMRKVILAGQREILVRKWAQLVDKMFLSMLETRNATGKDVRETILIMDLHGYNLRQHACLLCFPTYFDWVRNYENNYPQALGSFYMINTPRIFHPLLELLKGVFSQHTQKVLKVIGPDKKEWQKDLLSFIDEGELLQHYGGKRP